ncbi:uncharacterized protein Tco025E_10008 [Trypanosoma conorhini]|uniref:Uncharacterized protein n=1 Tax=Trypanosoma conorhini TaxID=83891 RepID=A0A422MQJ4_9TRYP|nr:uncharacterized protein Tco025E_10008 [Trypanosoma conorhini]RNE95476.1 hypothetical protein Tco025E_10008 [Trypanosoma conorhini]
MAPGAATSPAVFSQRGVSPPGRVCAGSLRLGLVGGGRHKRCLGERSSATITAPGPPPSKGLWGTEAVDPRPCGASQLVLPPRMRGTGWGSAAPRGGPADWQAGLPLLRATRYLGAGVARRSPPS